MIDPALVNAWDKAHESLEEFSISDGDIEAAFRLLDSLLYFYGAVNRQSPTTSSVKKYILPSLKKLEKCIAGGPGKGGRDLWITQIIDLSDLIITELHASASEIAGVSKDDWYMAVNPVRQAVKQNTTERDVEHLIEMAYNRGREFFREVGYNTWQQWWAADPDEVVSAIANDADLYNYATNFLDEEDDYDVRALLDAYKNGDLKGRYREPIILNPQMGPSRPLSLTQPEPWSPSKKDLGADEAKTLYTLASSRLTRKNSSVVVEARKSIFLAFNSDKTLAEKIGVPKKDLDKQIRKFSGLTATALETENRLNLSRSSEGEVTEIEHEYRWSGITNTSYLGRAVLDPDDMSSLFGKIHVEKGGEKSGYFHSPGSMLRHYIAQVALAIDTRMSYRDLEFKIGTFERHTVRGEFTPGRKPTITVRADSPFTVAHEMGHYLDFKFGREYGLDSYSLSDSKMINTTNEFYRSRYAHEHLRWAEKFHQFVDELMTRTDTRSEYTQRRHETFARFVSFFVTWTSKVATKRSFENSPFRDKFTDLDCRNWVRLLQEKSYLDANVPMRRRARISGDANVPMRRAGVEASLVTPKEFSAALSQAKEVDRRVKFLSDYSLEEYSHMKLFLTPDAQAGYAIKQDGDIVNLFNVSQIKGLGRQLVDQAIANGGTHLDAFEGKLTDLYRSKGFEEVKRVPFDPQYAPEGWTEEEGTPDIVYMQHSKASVSTRSVPRAMMEGMFLTRSAARADEADAQAAAALSGTRVQEVHNFHLSGPERIVGAVVITEDKVYPFDKRIWVDKHHATAAERAFAAGAAGNWEDFIFTDAFLTSRGELIDRFQSLLRFDVSESEQVYTAGYKSARGLEHYTQRTLVTTDPVYHGEGISGNESKRKRNDPENWVDRTYFYLEGTEPEQAFMGMKKYRAILPVEAKIYDMSSDPDNLALDCRNSIGYLNLSCYEKKIKDAGYFGFQNKSSAVPNAVAVFYPLSVELAEERTAAVGLGSYQPWGNFFGWEYTSSLHFAQPEEDTNLSRVEYYKRMMEADKPLPPIIVDAENNIIDGHHRWLAAEQLGIKKVPIEIDRLGSEQNEFDTHEPESIQDPYPSGQHLIGEMALTFTFVKEAGSTENYLASIGATPEVIGFIMEQAPELSKRLVNEVRKNPALSISDLQGLVSKFAGEKKYEPTKNEIDFANALDDPQVPGFRAWVLLTLKKMRARTWGEGNQNWFYKLPTGELEALHFLQTQYFPIRDWARALQIQIMSYSFKEASNAEKEWHASMVASDEGEFGKKYEEKNVVHQFSNGWTIQEVRTENDLTVEGEKMGHCVGGYCELVGRGDAAIYSLRDPKNEPHVTIEVSPQSTTEELGSTTPMPSQAMGWKVKQIKGKENKEPIPEYREMIKEWFVSLDRGNITMALEEEDLEEQLYLADFADWGDIISGAYPHENEYGILQGEALEKISPKIISSIAEGILDKATATGRGWRMNARHQKEAAEKALEALADLSWDADLAKIRKFVIPYKQPLSSCMEALEKELLKVQESFDYLPPEDMPPYPEEEDYPDSYDYERAVADYEKYEHELYDEAYRESPAGITMVAYDRWQERRATLGHKSPFDIVKMLENPETRDQALHLVEDTSD